MIRVLLCDDQDVVREGMRAILGTAPGFEVVGAAEDGGEAVELAGKTAPDIVLMDQPTVPVRGDHPKLRQLDLREIGGH